LRSETRYREKRRVENVEEIKFESIVPLKK